MHAADPIQRVAGSLVEGSPQEEAVVFRCDGDDLVGILARAQNGGRRGVLVVVGGPQYRAGSHRQFTLLARTLAANGTPAFRFDRRGMGDSAGSPRNFDTIGSDIAAAISTFQRLVAGLEEIVLWGLCDAASAAMMYAATDARVGGIVAVNPWVRSEETLAQSRVKYYYPRRLIDRDFWAKLLRGNVSIGAASGDFLASVRRSRYREAQKQDDFITRMRCGLEDFGGHSLVVLSGNDLTAREFCEVVAADTRWTRAIERPSVKRIQLRDADHTFSTPQWRLAVERHTLEWLASW
jgi:uncharacterized protein